MSQTMYPAIPNSPITELVSNITDTQTTIQVADVNSLPDAPNIATIGIDTDNPETILYEEKNENSLIDVTRGFQGTTQTWDAGTKIARMFTEYDYDTLRQNMEQINTTVTAHLAETTSYVAIATRDISLTGDQDISLIVSKTPKSVVIYSFINDVVCASWGFVTSVTQTSMAKQANNTMVNPSSPIYLEVSAGNLASGVVALSGGKLTITWSKTGSPTGTAQIRLMANYHD